MDKLKTWIFFGIAFSLLISGCSDPSSPTKTNYQIAIKKHFETREDFPHCFFRYNFPIQVNSFQLKMQGISRELEFLAKEGLVTKSTQSSSARKQTREKFLFELTDKGLKHFIPERGLCMGEPELTGIKDVSEPYEERGKTYVRGTYTWTVRLPGWAMKPEFLKSELFGADLYYFKLEKLEKGEDREDYFVLTLNDQGWQL